jgi:hypothetical protein
LTKLVEAVFKGRDTESGGAAHRGAQHIQQKPKTGDQRDGRERQNCESMARQAD